MTTLDTDARPDTRLQSIPAGAILRILLAVAIGAVLLVGVPLYAGDYLLSSIIIPAVILGLAGVSLNLLMGFAGLTSLGSAAFMSVGAFTSYNLLLRASFLPLPVVLTAAGLIAALAGVLFGLPSLRIKGFYLGASTLGAQFFIEWLFTNFKWFSNDSQTITISAPRLEIFGTDLTSPVGRYLLAIAATLLLVGLAFLLINSRIGREWQSIRDHEQAARVTGIPVARRKLQAYAVSSFFLGIAGTLWAFAYLGTADAHSFNLDKSFQILFIVLIGGSASISGNFLGSAFIVLTPIALNRLSDGLDLGAYGDQGALANIQHIIFGVLIIVLLIYEPNGLTALLKRLLRPSLRSRTVPKDAA